MAARLTTYLVAAIVATTLIAGLIVGAQRDDSTGPVDLIVHNAHIYTADGDGTRAEAVAIRGNQILKVGREREIMRLQRPQTTLIDAGGGTVLPGFNDAHAHVMAGGLSLQRVALDDAATVEEIQERVRLWADANPDREWVVGHGWHSGQFAGGPPRREQLDAAIDDRPVVLVSQDGRSSWVNSAALTLAGITRRSVDPSAGKVVRDPDTGEATGVLEGAAMSLVSRRIPPPTREERIAALRAALAEAHTYGITSLQNVSGDLEELALFEDVRRSGGLTVRIYTALGLTGPFTNADRALLLNTARQYPDDPILKSGAVKIRLTEATDAQAATLPAVTDTAAGAKATLSTDDLNRSVRLIDAEGWQVMIHAADDRAVRLALDAYEHAARSNRAADRDRRHRVEHAGTEDPVDLRKFERLGVLASLQPLTGSPAREVPQPAGSPFASLEASGARVALGSDWPAAPLNPMPGIQAVVSAGASGPAISESWSAEQRSRLEAALNAYTSGAAWASFDEQRKGVIAPGMLADLVILSGDIFEAPPADLARARVAVTIFDGKIVYRREHGTD